MATDKNLAERFIEEAALQIMKKAVLAVYTQGAYPRRIPKGKTCSGAIYI